MMDLDQLKLYYGDWLLLEAPYNMKSPRLPHLRNTKIVTKRETEIHSKSKALNSCYFLVRNYFRRITLDYISIC